MFKERSSRLRKSKYLFLEKLMAIFIPFTYSKHNKFTKNIEILTLMYRFRYLCSTMPIPMCFDDLTEPYLS